MISQNSCFTIANIPNNEIPQATPQASETMTLPDREQCDSLADPVDAAKSVQTDDGETEDEEVKRTCLAGHSRMRDSELRSERDENVPGDEKEMDDDNDADDDYDDKEDEESQSYYGEENEGLVEFVSGQIPKNEGTVCRPTPMIPKLTTHAEETQESSSDSEESRSVNARGAPLSLTTDSNVDMDSSSEDEEEDLESVDGDDEDEDEDSVKQPFPDGGDENESDYVENQAFMQRRGGDDETENETYAIVGASGASVDEKWRLDKQKRVLSSNTLTALNREAGHNAEEQKRMRSSPTGDSIMPELSLGLAAFDEIQPLPRQYLLRGDSPFHSSDEEEGDKMLSEELEEKPRGTFDNSPIPLLTPPQSPQREYVVDDENTSAVEWPSNLVVDSAMMIAVMDLRPLSPASLQDLDEQEEDTLKQADTSSLTPLLRSIYVGNI